jgi:hypothetical protein
LLDQPRPDQALNKLYSLHVFYVFFFPLTSLLGLHYLPAAGGTLRLYIILTFDGGVVSFLPLVYRSHVLTFFVSFLLYAEERLEIPAMLWRKNAAHGKAWLLCCYLA